MALFQSPRDRLSKGEALRRTLQREWTDDETRGHLFDELRRFNKELKHEEVLPFLVHQDGSVRALGEELLKERVDAKSAEAFFKLLVEKDPRIQSAAFNAMIRANPAVSVPQLGKLVTTAPAASAVRAMITLATLPVTRVGVQFARFLVHEKREIRQMALVKVSESESLLADKRLQRTISGMSEDEDDRIRVKVMEVLATVTPGEAIRACLQRFKDPSPSVQQAAVRVLSLALDRLENSAEAEERLLTLLIDGADSVRNGILGILMKRGDRERMLRSLLIVCKQLTGWMRDRTIASLRPHADKLSQAVVGLLEDPDDDVRGMALTLASSFGTQDLVLPIVGRLKDGDWMIRMLAAEVLGRIRDPQAVTALLEGIKDPDVACQCVEALAAIRDPRSLVSVTRELQNPRAEIRLAVLDALRSFSDKRVLTFVAQVRDNDPDPQVRERAADAHTEIQTGKKTAGLYTTGGAARRLSLEELHPLERKLFHAREAGASDLHVLVDSPPKIRVYGRLQTMPGDPYTSETSRAEVLGILTSEQQAILEQKRQIDFCHTLGDGGRYRCSIYWERKGLAGSFRIIPREIPTFKEVGLPAHLADLVNYQQGLAVVAGASGSGKTTTLAALVNLINEKRRSHVLVFEDPIEFIHPPKGCLINQRQVHRHTHSYSTALRGALREDPDIIVVGEMRDPETVRLAIEASETGHLVVGTMNTTSAPKTIDRIIEFFPPQEQPQVRMMLSETIRAVISQSLIPNANSDGRAACFEILMGTLGVRNLIRENKTYQLVGQMQLGEQQGHITVDACLAQLVAAGKVSPEQAWLRAQNKESFEGQVSADFLSGQFMG